jgi:hypothetical protein
MFQIAIALANIRILTIVWGPAVTRALMELKRRGLKQFELNQLREALVAIGESAVARKYLGDIAQKL